MSALIVALDQAAIDRARTQIETCRCDVFVKCDDCKEAARLIKRARFINIMTN